MDQLQRRGLSLANMWYPLCGREEETIDHLLLFCANVQRCLGIAVRHLWCQLGAATFSQGADDGLERLVCEEKS